MKLTKRLKSIADIAEHADIIADIGSDHGMLAVYLIENGIAQKVIATDISELSLQKTKDLAKSHKINENILTFCGNGLEALLKCNSKIELGIIAGMGGYEIIKIIAKYPQFIGHYILSPQQNTDYVRINLNYLGFEIIRDFIVLDKDKFYDIIEARHGKQVLNFEQTEWGITNLENPSEDFIKFLDKRIKISTDSLQHMIGEKHIKTEKKLNEILQLKESLIRRM